MAGFLIVLLTMVEMFSIPRSYFVLGSIVATSTMILSSYLLLKDDWKSSFKGKARYFVRAGVAAVARYLFFLGGNLAIRTIPALGLSSSNEQNIYNLFSGIPIPLLVVVLLLDAVGFEMYFRGNILRLFRNRTGVVSVFIVAAIDALIHLSTFNLLFPATTFVAASIWGLYYFKTKHMSSTIASHFIWDILVFIIAPIR